MNAPAQKTMPSLEIGASYYAKDAKGQWHYLNHANVWCTCPPPFPTLPNDSEMVISEAGAFRYRSLRSAAMMDASSYAGHLDPPDVNTEEGHARALAIVSAGYGFTVDSDGYLHACVSGDMGYANTGIQVDMGNVWSPEHVEQIVMMFRMFLHGLNSRLKDKQMVDIDDACVVFRHELSQFVDAA